MSKKSRRTRNTKARRARAAANSSQPGSQSTLRVEIKEPEQDTLNVQEYQYVTTDLQRMAILAAAMFALLIALSFFIQ